uniref:Uncharacterized protein n=1 Tax=Oryza punctata TaxID=4537 RepID=A0A0E0K2W9_ORYPU
MSSQSANMTLGVTAAWGLETGGWSVVTVRQLESADDDSCAGSDESELAGSLRESSESAGELAADAGVVDGPWLVLPPLLSTRFFRLVVCHKLKIH